LGETDEKDYINLYGSILRMKNILEAFDEFKGNAILSGREFQDFQSKYLDLYDKYRVIRTKNKEKIDNVTDDIVFEIELVKQVEVNIDYILMLVALYHKSNCTDQDILESIHKAVDSSTQLRNKRSLIEQFIKEIKTDEDVHSQWTNFIKESLENEIRAIISQENLKGTETHNFITNSLRDGEFKATGTEFDQILPPVSRFSKNLDRASFKERIIEQLQTFFDKFTGLF
jgi:type I restriction enzyme R subunit